MNKKIEMSKTKKVTISAIIMAVYVVVMMITQGIAFGFLQIRVATAIYSTAYLFPFLILPLGLSNSISNMLLGGMEIFIEISVKKGTLLVMLTKDMGDH